MKLRQNQKIRISSLALAFLIPFGGMLFVMLVSQYEPFGRYSMLYSDMYHQYYPFFVAFRKALLSGDSLLYSWNVGMGMDYLGLIAYYLASPMYLFSILVPEGLLLEFFSLLMPVKLGLAGLFFAVFLKHIFRKEDYSISMFGGFYGLCAWALGFQWNIMWLDTFALLPLVVLGAVWLLRDRKFILYTVSLFFAVFSNYYIGFFVCIFVFLLFFVYEICRWKGWKRFFGDLFCIALFSLLAIGMTAVLELPAFAALSTTQSGVNKFPTGFRLNIADSNTVRGLLDAMKQVAGNMGGSIKPNFKEGLPNIYCGVGTVLLAFLYLMARNVKLRDKVCAVLLLLFLNVSFIIRQLDYIWHGFHFTNMIPYRFSFLYCFVMLYMAYRAWLLRRKFRLWQVLAAGGLTAAVLMLSNDWNTVKQVELLSWELAVPVYKLYNMGFLLVYMAILAYGAWRPRVAEDAEKAQLVKALLRRNSRRAAARVLVLGVIALELIATLVSFGLYFPGTSVKNYPKGTNEAASMIRYMHEREEDTPFYRAETTHSQTLNDGALNGYNGVSAFTSSANVKITEFMKALGYGAKNTYNRYCYEEASPVSDLFLNLKYRIERDGKDKSSFAFEDLHHYGNVHLLRNNYWLPLGFLAEESLGNLDFGNGNGTFAFQNDLFTAATGIRQDVWKTVENVSVVGVGTQITENTRTGYCKYSDSTTGSSITYSYRIEEEGFLCIHVNLPKRNDVYIVHNGVELYKETTSLPQMMAVADVKPGDIVDIRLTCKAGESSSMTVGAALLDHDLFRQGYEILSANTMVVTNFENTLVEGVIQCDRSGILYTSIPQNGNWSATVNGRPAQVTLVGDVMMGIKLEEGIHEVRFVYRNPAFSLGWKISLICLAGFLFLVWRVYKPNLKDLKTLGKKQGRFQK